MTITALRREDHRDADLSVLESVGWPRSGVAVAILTADGRHVPPGETGEIAVKGDSVLACYWNNPTATAAAIRDGHCLTRMPRFKRPKRYVFVGSLPTHSYGKVSRRELHQWVAAR